MKPALRRRKSLWALAFFPSTYEHL
jgi:hypothetical protein